MWTVADTKCYLDIECYFAEHYSIILLSTFPYNVRI